MSTFKPSLGFNTIEDEFESRTVKAFRSGADYIFIDSRRMQFQLEAAEYCLEHGWLSCDGLIEIDEQYSQQRYRLTEAGKLHWRIA